MTAASPEIFSNVAAKDSLALFAGSRPDFKKIMRLLEFQKSDVARVTGVAQSSVRWDDQVPAEVRGRFQEWANLLNLVAEFFEGDAQKTALWFALPNPSLGNIAPRDMIRFGRTRRLMKFVVNALGMNRPRPIAGKPAIERPA